jgi:hypothetical protein
MFVGILFTLGSTKNRPKKCFVCCASDGVRLKLFSTLLALGLMKTISNLNINSSSNSIVWIIGLACVDMQGISIRALQLYCSITVWRVLRLEGLVN